MILKNIIISYGDGYDKLVSNWYSHYKSTNPEHSDLLVYTTPEYESDYSEYDIMLKSSDGFPTSGPTSTLFKTLVYKECLLDVGDFLYSDLDAIWTKDITPVISDYLTEYDMVFSTVTHSNAYPKIVRDILGLTICTGFFASACNENTLKFFNDVHDKYMLNVKCNDQYWVNVLLVTPDTIVEKCNDGSYDLINNSYSLKVKLLNEHMVFRGNVVKDDSALMVWHPNVKRSFSANDTLKHLDGLGLTHPSIDDVDYNVEIVNTGGFRYRLGDIVLKNNNAISDLKMYPNYKDTIGYAYLMNTVEHGFQNWSILGKIVDEYILDHNIKLPNDDELVVHLRLGDRGLNSHNGYLKNTLSKLKTIINTSNVKYVTIVTALHFHDEYSDDDVDVNMNTLKQITTALKDMNVAVNIRSSDNPDIDFTYMVKAKHLFITIGNFSLLIGILNSNNIYANSSKILKRVISLKMCDAIPFIEYHNIFNINNDLRIKLLERLNGIY